MPRTTPTSHPRRTLAYALILAVSALCLAGPAGADETKRKDLTVHDQAELIAKLLRSSDLEERLKAVTDAAVNGHESLTSPLIKALGDKEAAIRTAAYAALGARTDVKGKAKAAKAIGPKLPRLEKTPGAKEELLAAIQALHDLAQPTSIKALMGGIKHDSDVDVVEARLMAVANIPSKKSIDELIQFLGKGKRGGMRPQRAAASKALKYATGQSGRGYGNDPDAWRAWWRKHEKDFDPHAMAAARAEAKQEAADRAAKQKARKDKRKQGKGKKQDGGKKKDPADGA